MLVVESYEAVVVCCCNFCCAGSSYIYPLLIIVSIIVGNSLDALMEVNINVSGECVVDRFDESDWSKINDN